MQASERWLWLHDPNPGPPAPGQQQEQHQLPAAGPGQDWEGQDLLHRHAPEGQEGLPVVIGWGYKLVLQTCETN